MSSAKNLSSCRAASKAVPEQLWFRSMASCSRSEIGSPRSAASPTWLSRRCSRASTVEINTAPVRCAWARMVATLSKSTPILANCTDCASSDLVTRCTSRVLVVPGCLEAPAGFVERRVGRRGAFTRVVKRLRQSANLRRATHLQAVVDRPGISADLGNQMRNAYVAQPHRTARKSPWPRNHMSHNEVAPSARPSPLVSEIRTFQWPSPSVSTYPVTPFSPAHSTRSATPLPSVSNNRSSKRP